MLTETSKTAIQALVFIAQEGGDDPCPPATIAQSLGASPSYVAKIDTLLVKAGILKTFRGVRGGVKLGRPLDTITLLDVVEACQGKVLGDYCEEYDKLEEVCGFHVAMHELQGAIVASLEKWTLTDLLARPAPVNEAISNCRMICASR